MKIKKEYNYTNKRQIWRLLPTKSNKLVIEERDLKTKEVYFNCIDIISGVSIFKDFQLEEKYWVGIEIILDNIILFHKYPERDMPEHRGIIALDINSGKILWQNEDYIFLFIWEDKIYCYQNMFEGRKYYTIDIQSGEYIEELGEDSDSINILREKSFDSISYEGYLFPEIYNSSIAKNNSGLSDFMRTFREKHVIVGEIEFIQIGDYVLLNSHEPLKDGNLKNTFRAIEILSKKIIFEEKLNSQTKAFVPDSFFIKDDFLFLLIEKTKLTVCSINKT
jgi:hypothetical protein